MGSDVDVQDKSPNQNKSSEVGGDCVCVVSSAVFRFSLPFASIYAKHTQGNIADVAEDQYYFLCLKSMEEFATPLCVGWLFALLVCVTKQNLKPTTNTNHRTTFCSLLF